MNLTKSDREAFVNAVMNDVPKEDYNEQAHSYLKKRSIVHLPKALQEAIKKDKEVLDHVETTYVHVASFGVYLYGNSYIRVLIEKDEECVAHVEKLSKLSKEQALRLDDLRSSLTGVIGMCRTLKQAKERLPEFEKYLPAERGATGVTNLPIVNLIANLTQMGWPKGEQKAA